MPGARVFSIFGDVTLNDRASAALGKLGTRAEQVGARIGGSFDKAARRTDEFARRVEENADRIRAAGAKMAAAGAAVTTAFGGILFVASDFEAAMQRVAAVGVDTEEEFVRMTDAARHLGETTQFTATQAANALALLRQAGLGVDQAITALGPTLELAAAGELSLADAAGRAAGVLFSLRKDASELSGINDILVKTFQTLRTDVAKLTEGLVKVGSIADSAGVDLADLTTALGTLIAVGREGAEAGTGLRGVIVRLISDVGPAAKIMDTLSRSVRGTDYQFTTIVDAVRLFEEAIGKGLLTQTQATALAIQAFGLRAGPSFTDLLKQGGDALEGYTARIRDSEGAAADAAKTLLEGLRGALTILRSALEGLSIALGYTGFLGLVEDLTERTTKVVNALTEWVKENPRLAKGLTVAGAAAGVLLTAVGGFLIVFPTLIKLLASSVKWIAGTGTGSSLAGAFKFLLRFIAPPAGLIVAAVVIFREELWEVVKAVAALVLAVGRRLVQSFRDFWEWLGPVATILEGLYKIIRDSVLWVLDALYQTVRNIIGGVAEMIKTIATWIDVQQDVVDSAADAADAGAELGNRLADAREEADKAADSGKSLTDVINDLGEGLQNAGAAAATAGEEIARFQLDPTWLDQMQQLRDIEGEIYAQRERARQNPPPGPDFNLPAGPADLTSVATPGPAGGPDPLGRTQAEEEAAERLGVVPLSVLRERAEEARKAYEVIARSGDFSGRQIQAAYEAALDAQREVERAVRGRGRGGVFGKLLEELGDFATRSGGAIDGLARSGVDALFGRRGLLGSTWEERLRAIGEDFANQFAPTLLRTLGSIAVRGIKALGGLIGGQGRRGALQLVGDQSEAALGGVGRLFGGVEDAAYRTDRSLGNLSAGLRAFGTGPAAGAGALLAPAADSAFSRALRALWREFLRPVGEGIWKAVRALWTDFLRPAGEAIGRGLRALWVNFIKPAGQAIWMLVRPLWEHFLRPVGQALWMLVKPLWTEFLSPVLGKLWDILKSVLQPLWENFLKPVGKALWSLLEPILRPLWENFLKPVGKALWSILAPVLKPLWENFLKPVGKALWSLLEPVLAPLWRAFFSPPARAAATAAAGTAADAVGATVGDGAPSAGRSGAAAGGGGALQIFSAITGAITAVSSVIGNFQTRTTNDRLALIELNTRIAARLLGFQGETAGEESVERTHDFEVLGTRIERAWEDTIHGSLRQIAVSMVETEVRISAMLGTIRPWFEAQDNFNLAHALGADGSFLRALGAEGAIVSSLNEGFAQRMEGDSAIVAAVQTVTDAINAKDFSPRIVVNVPAPSPAREFGLSAEERASRAVGGTLAEQLLGG